MTLDEAIKHCEEVADFCEDSASRYDMTDPFESHMACQDGKCANEHRQLAEWLRKLKAYEEAEEEINRKMRSGQWSDAVVYGMSKAIVIMKKCRFAHNCKEVNADE